MVECPWRRLNGEIYEKDMGTEMFRDWDRSFTKTWINKDEQKILMVLANLMVEDIRFNYGSRGSIKKVRDVR